MAEVDEIRVLFFLVSRYMCVLFFVVVVFF